MNVTQILNYYHHDEQDVLYVVYQNEQCTLAAFKTLIHEYKPIHDNDLNNIDLYYDTMIVGED